MKYINQKKYPDMLYVTKTEMDNEQAEQGRKTTISSSGCGLCAAIMVVDRLIPNVEFSLEEAVKMSYDCGANRKAGTTYSIFVPYFAEKFGLDYEMTNDSDRLRYCLRTGGAAVILVKGDREGYTGVFSHVGHYITAISEDRDGRIAILDPSYTEGKYEEENRIGKVELKNDVVALCDIGVLEEDSTTAVTKYFLFWRK